MSDRYPEVLLVDDFFQQADALYATLRACVEWDTSMISRHTASFGEPYNYSQMRYAPRPLPPSLLAVSDRLAELLDISFNNCLLNLYLSGDSTMGFHRDETDGLLPGTGVAIVSLGAMRSLTFRRCDDHQVRCDFPLPAGSLLYMDAGVQDNWQHAVRKQKNVGPRMSLTWRAVRQDGENGQDA